MNQRHFIIFALCSATCMTASAQITLLASKGQPGQETRKESFTKASIRPLFLTTDANALAAGFSYIADGNKEVTWSEDFDEGTDGWTLTDAENFGWETKTATGNYSFTGIDPDDVQSLHIEGDYRYANRGKATALSPAITIPRNATFSGYVGYSLNFNDNCTLTIFESEDGEEWDQLWSSLDDEGEKPWAWRKFSIDMTASAGKTVQFKFEYGNSAGTFDDLGYMGGFYIDGLSISGTAEATGVSVMTGEPIKFADTSTGNPTSWSWSFPGGTPSESTDQYPEVYYTRDGSYDVSLTVSDGTNTASKTIEGFVTVTGVEPTAKILPPATFHYSDTRFPMVAPLAKVQFSDASEGFPTSWDWVFTGVDATAGNPYISVEQHPEVGFMFQHQQAVGLTVENEHGSSSALMDISVEYEGFINNLQPDDELFTFDLGDGYGEFPGTNKLGITEYAEKFSKPSQPIFISGVKVYFTQAEATEVIDQIASIKVSLNKSENGLLGEQLDFMSWDVFELDTPSGSTLVGTDFIFSKPVLIDDEFFVVVSGIPEKNDGVTVSFATAKFRDQGNTAYFKQRGEWKTASSYFPAGSNHTSYMIQPYIVHSVMVPLSETPIRVDAGGGTATLELFSYMGYETPVACDASWCRITSEPNGLTLDEISIEYDALPNNVSERSATFTFTDGASSLDVVLFQSSNAAIHATTQKNELKIVPTLFNNSFTVMLPERGETIEITDISGKCVYKLNATDQTAIDIDSSAFAKGIYFIKTVVNGKPCIVKGIKR